MTFDAELSTRMEQALITRAKSGPNSNPPAAERKVPRASVLSQGCGRRTYYYLVDAPEDPLDALGACAFQDGKDFEEGILEDLRDAIGPSILGRRFYEYQVPCATEWFKGSADMATLEGELSTTANYAAVYDAKSANPASFAITVRKGVPSESYVAQLSLYAFALGAKECVIAYRKKGGTKKDGEQVYAVFRFPPDMAVVEQMKAQAIEAMNARDGHAPIPARAYKQTDWNCNYCNYKTFCWEGK